MLTYLANTGVLSSMNETEKEKKELFYCKIAVPKHGIKKNGRTIFKTRGSNRSFIGKSKDLQALEKLLALFFTSAKNRYGLKAPINVPVHAKFIFHMNTLFTKKKMLAKNGPDLSNLYQLPEDVMQAVGIIENDNLIFSHDGSRKKDCIDNILEIWLYEFDN